MANSDIENFLLRNRSPRRGKLVRTLGACGTDGIVLSYRAAGKKAKVRATATLKDYNTFVGLSGTVALCGAAVCAVLTMPDNAPVIAATIVAATAYPLAYAFIAKDKIFTCCFKKYRGEEYARIRDVRFR